MPVYNKLVRDSIPEIIAKSGKKCVVRTLDDAQFLTCLEEKLHEELIEYKESGDVTELADLVEVVYATLEAKGVSLDAFEALRMKKKEERGGFAKRLLLENVED